VAPDVVADDPEAGHEKGANLGLPHSMVEAHAMNEEYRVPMALVDEVKLDAAHRDQRSTCSWLG
jgi:hypothetical protein